MAENTDINFDNLQALLKDGENIAKISDLKAKINHLNPIDIRQGSGEELLDRSGQLEEDNLGDDSSYCKTFNTPAQGTAPLPNDQIEALGVLYARTLDMDLLPDNQKLKTYGEFLCKYEEFQIDHLNDTDAITEKYNIRTKTLIPHTGLNSTQESEYTCLQAQAYTDSIETGQYQEAATLRDNVTKSPYIDETRFDLLVGHSEGSLDQKIEESNSDDRDPTQANTVKSSNSICGM